MKSVEFIKQNGLSALCQQFGILAKRHGKYPNLVMLKYNQIESPMAESVVQECRGIILDEADDWRVISFPYRKFFNQGEPLSSEIDWPTARVYEKLDGSLCTLYYYRGEWQVASSGLPDASGPVNAGGLTFAELFWKTWKICGYEQPPGSLDRLCLMFELMTPMNRVVVPHTDYRLVLHGIRVLDSTLREIEPEGYAKRLGYACVRTFPLGTIAECLATAEKLDPMQSEGYVVCDGQFRRVKVKSPAYVALSHARDSMSARNMLDIVRKNESEEFLAYFPEWAPTFHRIKAEIDELCAAVESDFERIRGIGDQKAFAAKAMKCRWSSPLFMMRKGTCKTAREFAAVCTQQAMERAMNFDPANYPAMIPETL